jgi:LytS/YehU family sensor histidine kinase
MKSIMNQLDPHFTFNIFFSFSNLINEKDTERANYIFDKYAGLLKTSVINSANVQISLREELDFVASYLELEKFRYSDKFTFQINIRESINDQIAIPKMIVHIFVENAIKHGIRHLNSGGKLKIDGTQNNGTIEISIQDNGIGRVKAKEIGSASTGKGLVIIGEIIENYNKLYNHRISYKINDLYENDQAAGTKVQIRIPVPV